jgi:hypothetical protein
MQSDRVRSTMTPAAVSQPSTRHVRFAGSTLVFVRGSATGWVYRFSPEEPIQTVDGRDVPGLLARPLFRMAR